MYLQLQNLLSLTYVYIYVRIYTDVTIPTATTEEQEVPHVLTTNKGMYIGTYVLL